MATSKNQRRNQRRHAQRKQARRMETWRKKKPLLLCPVMVQSKEICYAIAYVRQLEFHLKLHDQMPQDQHLSIQDFLDRIPADYLTDDGALKVGNKSNVLTILKEEGLLLAKDCPLTENLDHIVREDINLPRYYAKKVTLNKLYGASGKVDKERYDAFHDNLIGALKRGVVAVSLTVYPSYSMLKHKEIYYPTDSEWDGMTEHYSHVMVCTGHNFDIKDNLYYEFQEAAGVRVGDQGFVRTYADLVYEFVEMEV